MKTAKTQFIKFFIFSMLFLMNFFKVYSQTDALSVRRDDNGKIKFARFLQSENSERKMTNGVTFLKSKLQLDDRDEFRLISEMTNKSGITTKRFQQYYKGIKVEEAQYVLRGRNDIITSMNGDFQDINLPTVEPVFSEQQALLKALSVEREITHQVRYDSRTEQNDDTQKGELVIARDVLNHRENSSFKLAWKFAVSDQMIFVDAMNGEIIQVQSLIFK